MLDLFQYLIYPSNYVEVISTAIVPKVELPSTTDDMVITVRYDDGSVATLLYTTLGNSGLRKEYVEIFGDGKTLVIDDFRSLNVYGVRKKGWTSKQDKGHLQELQAFAAYLRGGEKPPIPLQSIIDVTKVSLIASGGIDKN